MARTAGQPKPRESKPTQTTSPCAICGRHFTRKGDKRQHAETHSNRKPYLCSQCPSSFGAERSRIRHIERDHLEVQPYSCRYEDCGKTFSRNYLAKEHERQHHGARYPEPDDTQAPLGEEPAIPEYEVIDDGKPLPSNVLLRSERANLGDRFVRLELGDQEITMNFFPIWNVGYCLPNWKYFVDCLNVRGLSFIEGQNAFLAPFRDVHNARTLGKAIRLLMTKPSGHIETWVRFSLADKASPFKEFYDSDDEASSGVSVPSLGSLFKKRKRSEEQEVEGEAGLMPSPNKFHKSTGGFSTSQRANPNPLGLSLDMSWLWGDDAEEEAGDAPGVEVGNEQGAPQEDVDAYIDPALLGAPAVPTQPQYFPDEDYLYFDDE